MPGKITATIEERDLQAIDNVIYEPKQEELTARSVFPQK
ncbi:major capsid protein, partial [Listeria monocytogenes]|nr:major capsid protein [Listeria monocytogenes]